MEKKPIHFFLAVFLLIASFSIMADDSHPSNSNENQMSKRLKTKHQLHMIRIRVPSTEDIQKLRNMGIEIIKIHSLPIQKSSESSQPTFIIDAVVTPYMHKKLKTQRFSISTIRPKIFLDSVGYMDTLSGLKK